MERVLGGVSGRHDTERRQQAHDYDIRLPDGDVITLEVTQHVTETVIETDNLIAKRRWEFACLERDWFVDVVRGVRVETLHAKLPEFLKQLEDAGIDGQVFTHAEVRTDKVRLAALGVLSCRSYESHDPSRWVHVDQQTAAQSHGGADTVVEAVRRIAQKKATTVGNAKAAIERHLLIWMDSTDLAVRSAMEGGKLPSCVPDLPEEVDVAWVALSVRQPILWRVDRTGWSYGGQIVEEGLS